MHAFAVRMAECEVEIWHSGSLCDLPDPMKLAAAFLPLLLVLLPFSCAPLSSTPTVRAPVSWGNLAIEQDLIPKGKHGRWRTRAMRPTHITIHSTQNFSSSGTARAHAAMLRNGALKGPKNSLGYLTWHFTVDDRSIYQSLPVNEQGQHADYEGPGNRKSIGIEMCENRGGSRARTVDRTAKLTAILMKEHGIPLSNVVPHQHWRQIRYADKRDLGHKNCPHFLMDNGRPGRKWRAFLDKVAAYRRQL